MLLFAGSSPRASNGSDLSGPSRLLVEARAAAQSGDVIFKDGGGVWGTLAARFSHNDDGYGHVGVVSLDGDGLLFVIHAGGDPVSGEGRVQWSAFDQFLGASEAAALYRPAVETEAADAALAYLAAAAARNAPFDAAFSLDTEDALYCTELVWRAFSSAAGEDIVPEKSRRSGKTYLAIDDLQGSHWLQPVWSLRVESAAKASGD